MNCGSRRGLEDADAGVGSDFWGLTPLIGGGESPPRDRSEKMQALLPLAPYN